MPTYDAFLSFDRSADGRLADELTAELQRFAKPWYQLRARKIFRPGRAASAKTWDRVAAAIHTSRYLILIASPASASSDSVRNELNEWIQSSPDARERIRIVLSDGEIIWNEVERDFDFDRSTALNTALSGLFKSEPIYIDLRWARDAPRRIGRPEFAEAVATLVAALSSQPLDALYGLEFRQKRRARALLTGATASLILLLVLTLYGAREAALEANEARRAEVIARRSAQEALQQRRIAELSEKEAEQQRDLADRYRQEIQRLQKGLKPTISADDTQTVATLRTSLADTQQRADQYKTDAEASKKDAENARQQTDTFRAQAETARRQAESFRNQAEILRRQLAEATKQVGPLGKAKQYFLANLGKVLLILGGLLLIIICSTRLVSILLQLEVWPITILAPAFYLTPFGRNKLFRAYRSRLIGRTDVAAAASIYQDIPFALDNNGHSETGLFKHLSSATTDGNVVIIADGGRGKSTICLSIVHAMASGTLTVKGGRVEPVLIDGLDYAGDLAGSILSALRQHGVYGSASILATQLAAGNLFLIIDGYSEIRESYSKDDDKGDVPTFIRRNSPIGVLITSRSPLPPSVESSLGSKVCYRLLDLDEVTLGPFLASHLRKRATELHTLIAELDEFLPHLPRIPLMLKLVAAVFDENGTIPRQRVALFAEYTRVLFRPSVTNLNDASGFPYALRYLTRHTFLASGGDRGLTVSQGVMLLRTIKDVLADFRINTLPVDLIGFFVHAGIYRRNGDNLRFFHDSFESYLGATALEAEFREQKFDMIRQSAGNVRLIEMWDFLVELLSSEPDRRRLEEVLANIESLTGRTTGGVAEK